MSKSPVQSLGAHHSAFFLIILLRLLISCDGAAIPTTDVVIRSNGDVSLYSETRLEERFNLWAFSIGGSFLAGGTIWGPMVCAATPVVTPVPCLVAVASVVIGAIVTVVGLLVKGSIVPRFDLPDTIQRENWLAEYQATGKPVIVLHHDCYGPGCFQSEYSTHTTKGGRKLHRILTGPRQLNDGTNHLPSSLDRRDPYYSQGYDSYTPPGYGYEDKFLVDYLFEVSDTSLATDMVNAYDYDSYDAEWSFAGAVDTDYIDNTGQGYYCMNIGVPGYSSGSALSGYGYWGEETVEQDPDDEDQWIQQCAAEGQSDDYRTYEFDGRRK